MYILKKVTDYTAKGVTQSGFEYCIDKRVLNDWRLVTLCGKMTKGSDLEKIDAVDQALRMLFADNYENLINYIAENNDGFVPAEKLVAEFNEIVGSIKN